MPSFRPTHEALGHSRLRDNRAMAKLVQRVMVIVLTKLRSGQIAHVTHSALGVGGTCVHHDRTLQSLRHLLFYAQDVRPVLSRPQ